MLCWTQKFYPPCLALGMLLYYSVGVAAFSQNDISELDQVLEHTRGCQGIQGMAVSVVANGQSVLTKGYGYADAGNSKSVTEDTAFYIGSLTKAVTATLAGTLMDEGKISLTWDSPIRSVMGDTFQLSDPLRTEQTSLKDLLSHRMGVPGYNTAILVGLPQGTTRAQMADKIRHLCPTEPFRSSYIYNNYMVALAGHVTEAAAGGTWEELTRAYILDRLNMTMTGFVSDADQPEDVALAYNAINTHKYPVSQTLIHQVKGFEPAGAVYSTARDMSKYLLYQIRNTDSLRSGITSNVTDIFQRWNVRPGFLSSYRPKTDVTYVQVAAGLGWFEAIYRGYKVIWHNGEISTYRSQLFIIPDLSSGVFLTSSGSNQAGFGIERLVLNVLDRLLGLAPAQNEQQLCQMKINVPPSFGNPTPDVRPSHVQPGIREKLKPYMGTYRNPAFDDITIHLNVSDQSLHLHFGRFGHARLEPHPDVNHTFGGRYQDPLRALFWFMPRPSLMITFDGEHDRAKFLKLQMGAPEETRFVRNLDDLDESTCGSNAVVVVGSLSLVTMVAVVTRMLF